MLPTYMPSVSLTTRRIPSLADTERIRTEYHIGTSFYDYRYFDNM